MDKKGLKKLIAREGLILLLVILLATILKWSLLKMSNFWGFLDFGEQFRSIELRVKFINNIYWLIAGYLLIRFIIWAVRTLKEK